MKKQLSLILLFLCFFSVFSQDNNEECTGHVEISYEDHRPQHLDFSVLEKAILENKKFKKSKFRKPLKRFYKRYKPCIQLLESMYKISDHFEREKAALKMCKCMHDILQEEKNKNTTLSLGDTLVECWLYIAEFDCNNTDQFSRVPDEEFSEGADKMWAVFNKTRRATLKQLASETKEVLRLITIIKELPFSTILQGNVSPEIIEEIESVIKEQVLNALATLLAGIERPQGAKLNRFDVVVPEIIGAGEAAELRGLIREKITQCTNVELLEKMCACIDRSIDLGKKGIQRREVFSEVAHTYEDELRNLHSHITHISQCIAEYETQENDKSLQELESELDEKTALCKTIEEEKQAKFRLSIDQSTEGHQAIIELLRNQLTELEKDNQ